MGVGLRLGVCGDRRNYPCIEAARKITRVWQAGISCPAGTLFLLFTSLFLLLTGCLTPSNSDSVDLSFALLYNGYVNSLLHFLC